MSKMIGFIRGVTCAVALLLGACGSGGGGGGGALPGSTSGKFTVTVNVSGLSGSGLVLQDNGGDDLAVSGNGANSFLTALASGASYSVSVLKQPGTPTQFCSVASGSGQVGTTDISNINISCIDVTRFAYLANGNNTVSQYAIDPASGVLTPVGTPLVVAGATALIRIKTTPNGQFAYLLDDVDVAAMVYAARVDSTSGALQILSSAPTGGVRPADITISPNGKYLYALNADPSHLGSSNSSITSFTIGADGSLTPFTSAPVGVGSNPTAASIDSSGNFLYAASEWTGQISTYRIGQTDGTLTFVSATAPTGRPMTVAVSASGDFVYALDNASLAVIGYPINHTNGTLGVAGPEVVVGATSGGFSTIDPSGKFYLSTTAGAIYVERIDGVSGALARVGFTNDANHPSAVAVDPTGRFVYVGDLTSHTISAYALDSATGALTKLAGGDVAAPGAYPRSIAFIQ